MPHDELLPLENATPVSLYFGLEEGRTADLETVARAALAWAASLHAIFDNIEPGLTLKIEIVDGDEGSLWLNMLLKIEDTLETIAIGGRKFPRLWALAKGFAIIVVATPLSVTAEDVWRSLVGERPELAELSEESRKAIVDDLKRALNDNVAPIQKRQFYKEVQRDDAITSVGIASNPESGLDYVTSRLSFDAYLDPRDPTEILESTRKREEIMDVELVSPVLRNAERSWRFLRAGLPEFGAVMKDKAFLEAIGRGGVHVEMREGISMKVRIEFKERLVGPLWITEERSVIEVLAPSYDKGELPF